MMLYIRKRFFALAIVSLFFFVSYTSTSSIVNIDSKDIQNRNPREITTSDTVDIYVDDNANPSWYDATHVKTIKEGIKNASSGETIFVYNGTYHKNLKVNKSVTLIGENKNITFIKNKEINIHSQNVIIQGFDIDNVRGVTIHKTFCNNTIHDNIIENNDPDNLMSVSIYIMDDSNNNNVFNNYLKGDVDFQGSKNTICNNTLLYADIWGYKANNCTIFNNTLVDSTYGIKIWESSNNSIYGNVVKNNKQNGLSHSGPGVELFDCSNNNKIFNNTFFNCRFGLDISKNCNDNDIFYNNITDAFIGINIDNSENNEMHHNNLINCTIKALFFKSKGNRWHDNYWGRFRNLPKIIFGTRGKLGLIIWFNLDFYPAKKPYHI